MEISGKKVTVVGFGKSGLSAARLLHDKGADVTVTDCVGEEEKREQIKGLEGRNVALCLGNDGIEAVEAAELVVVSPGVPGDVSALRLAADRNIPVISEIELFSWYCRLPVVAITGTNGKTTVATLVAELLNALGHNARLGGNIGIPLTELIGKLSGEENVVAEVSSFQLEHIEKFHARVSVILNITPDHLDRYRDFEDYVLAKSRILANQGKDDFAVLNADDRETSRLAESAGAAVIRYSRKAVLEEGVFVDSGEIVTRWRGNERKIGPAADIRMRGGHNLENCLAAVAVGMIYGGDAEIMRKTVSQFPGLEHRLEYVDTVNGVAFFNDSKATNVEAVVEAVRSFECPVVLICGGRDKGSDYGALRSAAQGRVKSAVLFGESCKKLREAFQGAVPCVEEESFHSVFRAAFSAASRGDVVLLSPACSSFDMFSDFEERGKIFKAEVKNLGKET
jgi:UDP-N-acetylmuramoylalanine--D-glutamate ligase